MIVEIKSCDNQTAINSIRNIPRLTKKAIRTSFYKIGKDIKATAKELIIDGKKTGRIYKYNINGKVIYHVSSAPEQAPASLTGKLVSSVDYHISGSYSMQFGAGDGSPDMAYAGYLEEGTSKMAKRPYLITAINENERNNYVTLNRNIKKELT